MMKAKKGWGLTIPDEVKSELSNELITLLEADGHGISFPYPNAIQMRYMYKGKDYGRSFPVSAYKSWEKAIKAAMIKNMSLRIQYPNSGRIDNPDRGVRFHTCVRRSRDIVEYSYATSFRKADGKMSIRSFFCGSENTMTKERKRQAELAAWYYRRLFCITDDPDLLSTENTKGWQTKVFM